MASFETCVDFVLAESGLCEPTTQFKYYQRETLRYLYEMKDVIAVLPTGYGKSLIFQVLPWFFKKKLGRDIAMIALVISPLNSLIQDQLQILRGKGIKACCINTSGRE